MSEKQSAAIAILILTIICDIGTWGLVSVFAPSGIAIAVAAFGFIAWLLFWIHIDATSR